MKNKKNKNAKMIALIGITCIIWGFVTMFIGSVKKDQAEMNSRMDKIIKSYDKFTVKIEEFNTTRDNLHKKYLDKIYYETFQTLNPEILKSLNSYETIVSNVSKSTKENLREYCEDDIYYSTADVNNKCASYKQSYEEMVNLFVADVNDYNTNIDNYNAWVDKEKKPGFAKLEKYQTKKQYIDYNKDGNYAGRDESIN